MKSKVFQCEEEKIWSLLERSSRSDRKGRKAESKDDEIDAKMEMKKKMKSIKLKEEMELKREMKLKEEMEMKDYKDKSHSTIVVVDVWRIDTLLVHGRKYTDLNESLLT